MLMETVRISAENKEAFAGLLGEDLAEYTGRSCYGGIGVLDQAKNAVGVMLYELLNLESVEDTQGNICFAYAQDTEAIEAMLKEYTDHIVPEKDIAETLYELENEDKAKIFPENGFSFGEGESNTLELTLGDLKDHKLARSSKLPGYIKSTGSLSLIQYRKAINNVLLKGHKGAFEDMAYLPLRWFDTEISSCSVSGDKANGLFLIRRNPSGALIPALLFAYGPDFQKDLLYMINYSLRRAIDVCPPDTPLLIRMKNKSTRALAHKLLPDHVGKKVFVGNRIEK